MPPSGNAANLGQFFTPRPVVDFALAALRTFGARIERSRVVDPACGPGEWIAAALAAGAASATGVDCDPAMLAAWRSGGLASRRDALLIVADALNPAVLPRGRYDLVVGNPPFGAKLADRSPAILRRIALHYQLFNDPSDNRLLNEPGPSDLQRLTRFPTELLFLERFIGLTRDGGWSAIILPEGVLANARWRRVREWMLGTVTLHTVVSLPRATFRADSTTARTSLLLMHNRPPRPDHEVAVAAVKRSTDQAFDEVLRRLESSAATSPHPPEGLLPPPLFPD